MNAHAAPLAWALSRARAQTLSLVADVQDAAAWQQLVPGEHHPAWIVGHLLLGDVYLLHLLGAEALTDDFQVLLARYGPDSSPALSQAGGDRLAALSERLRAAGETRDRAVGDLSGDDLARTTPDPVLVRAQPTLAHHLHALVNHEGYHGGELMAWRRAHGLQPVPWAFASRRQGSVSQDP